MARSLLNFSRELYQAITPVRNMYSPETKQLLFGRRILSALRYFLSYPAQIKPFLLPGAFTQPPAEFTGPNNAYGKIRNQLSQLGVLQCV